jgi:DNA repair protein RecN (Recombination protein N)
MLTQLTVSNYALIESLELEFKQGFTVITGETGAGKSILLGALGLAIGNRAETDVLLDKGKKCFVEAVFSVGKLDLHEWFVANELDFADECVMRREIGTNGKSRAFINDTPVNLSVLKDLGEQLIDIHSQHESLHLSESTFQLKMLDHLAGTQPRLTDYRKIYREFMETQRLLGELKEVQRNNQAELEYVQFQFDELKDAKLSAEAYLEMEKQLLALSHSEEIAQAMFGSVELLQDNDQSVLLKLSELRTMIRKVEEFLPNLADLGQRIESATIELKDVTRELSLMSDHWSHDPTEIERIGERLGQINQLMVKHRVRGIEELISLRDQFEGRLAHSDQLEEQIERLNKQFKILNKDLLLVSAEISYARKSITTRVGEEITGVLRSLGMPNAVFQVLIEELEKPGPDGSDRVRFVFSANLGGVVQEISKIASGGEMSRLMLAVKSLLARKNMLPTIIFDEIDAGVSGEVAARMGRIMAAMSEQKQVVSITHLPQIAGKARHHVLVSKVEQEQQTRTHIDVLNQESRIKEIARMLSDDQLTEASMKAAIELIG